MQKIINFDDITREKTNKYNPIGCKFLDIHAEYL